MSTPDAEAWAEALTMYERRYSYVLVGPRAHQDWVWDVAAVMRREVVAPRSCRWIDVDEGEEERLEDPFFPFVLPPSDPQDTAAWGAGLRMVPRTSVERLLVMLASTWLDVPKERRWNHFESRRPELERKARVVLSRFPEGTSFYTNAGYPGDGTGNLANDPDFYQETTGCHPRSTTGISERPKRRTWSWSRC